ncbi:hypothetical protein [Actinophytocola sp. NPDC049390]|uniref:hypothetical protein n=1 Tax=Actinophytocola sp. NPDC049390 TaxID=3363894 RepID=UPI00378F87F4
MTTVETLRVATLAERPDLTDAVLGMESTWPANIRPDPMVIGWAFDRHAAHQLVVLDGDEVVARAATVPCHWDGDPASLPDTGWDEALRTSMMDTYDGRPLNTLCALEVAVVPGSGRGTCPAAHSPRSPTTRAGTGSVTWWCRCGRETPGSARGHDGVRGTHTRGRSARGPAVACARAGGRADPRGVPGLDDDLRQPRPVA